MVLVHPTRILSLSCVSQNSCWCYCRSLVRSSLHHPKVSRHLGQRSPPSGCIEAHVWAALQKSWPALQTLDPGALLYASHNVLARGSSPRWHRSSPPIHPAHPQPSSQVQTVVTSPQRTCDPEDATDCPEGCVLVGSKGPGPLLAP